jgi:DNA-binding IclR family transcriptional regulator
MNERRTEHNQLNDRHSLGVAAELVSALRTAEEPLSLGELSQLLGRPFRTVAYALANACRAGDVDRLDGGLYSVRPRPALAELFALVRACESEWKLDDRPGLFGLARRSH